jgi:hypothetical protein
MNTMPPPAAVAPAGNYETTRFNAVQHGILSRYAVLPWEDNRRADSHSVHNLSGCGERQ